MKFWLLLLLIFGAAQANAQPPRKDNKGKTQRHWQARDTAYVVSPAHCHFYKKADTSAQRHFTFVYSTKVVLLENKAASPTFSFAGAVGQLRAVKWEGYTGYVFDGFLTHLYVCRHEDCHQIEDVFDAGTMREYSVDFPVDCPANEGEGIDSTEMLWHECDSVSIRWRSGVAYDSYRSPSLLTQVYTIPHTDAQEVFLWAKLLYARELYHASLLNPQEIIEEEDDLYRRRYRFKYAHGSGNKKLLYFSCDARTEDKFTNKLIEDFTIEVQTLSKTEVRVTLRKNRHAQLVIKNRE